MKKVQGEIDNVNTKIKNFEQKIQGFSSVSEDTKRFKSISEELLIMHSKNKSIFDNNSV